MQESHLHSNMSLFKLRASKHTRAEEQIYIPICLYLNDIHSYLSFLLDQHLHSNMSLFKYMQTITVTQLKKIYIPICLYLNNEILSCFFYL